MLLSFQTALIPNNKEVLAFRKASGTARHAYNWANAEILEVLKLRETDKSVKIPSAIDLHKRLVAQVKCQHDLYYKVNKNVPQKALADLRQAWDRCFRKTSKREQESKRF
jgi:putative transposase